MSVMKVQKLRLNKNNTTLKHQKIETVLKDIKANLEIYVLILPTLLYFIIFKYFPMYGAQIAFKNFIPVKGICGSEWVGFKHFIRFFESPYFTEVVLNTFLLSVYSLIAGFPLPIALAILLNYQKNLHFKKVVQTVSYAPHFISTVVMVGMLKIFTSPINGIINKIIVAVGGEAKHFMASPEYFKHLFVWSGIWQNIGWSSIIYIGALSAISIELHEAAIVDGAIIWQRIWNIDLPGIAPTIIILLILSTGSVLSVGFEKVYLMQNDLNTSVSEVISTYTYKMGLIQSQYSFSSAVGLFNSIINFVLLITVNIIARKLGETSLF